MSEIPAPRAEVRPDSRLEQLLAVYAELKPQADETATRLKGITDAIKSELQASHPHAQRVEVAHPALPEALRLSYVESWRLDTKQLKADKPEVYVAYAQKSGSWQLRGVSA